jgi:hypothetical protein
VSWLKVNGIELARVVSSAGNVDGPFRDIGEMAEAADGSTRKTRQARKRDLTFSTVPLSGADALAWDGLLSGEGHVWSFDSSFYSSKGVPILSGGVSSIEIGGAYKYGEGSLLLESGEQIFSSGLQMGSVWTAAAWMAPGEGDLVFHHYVIRSDGRQWKDGVQGTFANLSSALTVASGELNLNADISPPRWLYFDDLVVTPYLWPTSWPAQVAEAGAAFGPTPFLACSGDMVREAASRRMLCASSSEAAFIAAGARDMRRLSFSLSEV